MGGSATLNRAPIRASRVTDGKARIATAPEAFRADSLAAFNRLVGEAAQAPMAVIVTAALSPPAISTSSLRTALPRMTSWGWSK